MALLPSWVSGIAGAVGAVAKAVTAALGFAQRQQDKQAGIDAQVATDQTAAAKINAAEAKAVTNAEGASEALREGKF